MGAGAYDHPSYLTRQQVALGRTLAGASVVSIQKSFLSAMRIRNVSATVVTAGTVASTNASAILKSGTTALGTFALSTNAVGATSTLGDLNVTIPAGTVLSVTNGTDATIISDLVAEMYIDPAGSWSGQG